MILFVFVSCLNPGSRIAHPTRSVEDPFTLFSALVDINQPKPILNPLHPEPFSDNSVTVPSPVNICLEHNLPPLAPELTATPTKRRHWTINRHSGRGRVKDGDEEDAHTSLPRREHATADYGSMSVLMAGLTAETTIQSINDQPKLFDLLRNSIDGRDVSSTLDTNSTEAAALNAQDYIWSLVYGGVDGLAYVRSLAEFVCNPSLPPSSSSGEERFPLEDWVENNIVDTITEGRHRLVRKIVHQLTPRSDEPLDPPASDISEDIRRSRDVYPQLGDLITALSSQIDIQNLVNRPLELTQAELEWSGAAFKQARRQQREVLGTLTIDNPMSTLVAPSQDTSNDTDKDDQEVLDYALEYSRQRLLQLIQSDPTKNTQSSGVEDPLTKDLRMNLLALSKRVPLQLLSVSSVTL